MSHRRPTLEKIEYDLSRLFGFPISELPNGLKFILWQSWKLSQDPAAPDWYLEQMVSFNVWGASTAEEILSMMESYEGQLQYEKEANGAYVREWSDDDDYLASTG